MYVGDVIVWAATAYLLFFPEMGNISWEQGKVCDLLTERNEQFPKSEDYPLMAFMAYDGVAP